LTFWVGARSCLLLYFSSSLGLGRNNLKVVSHRRNIPSLTALLNFSKKVRFSRSRAKVNAWASTYFRTGAPATYSTAIFVFPLCGHYSQCRAARWIMDTSLRPAPTTRRIRIVCISDTHNSTVKLPKGDVLIHAGDLTNQGSYSEVRFSPQTWKVVPVRHHLRLSFNMFL